MVGQLVDVSPQTTMPEAVVAFPFVDDSMRRNPNTLEDTVAKITGISPEFIREEYADFELSDLWNYNRGVATVFSLESTDEVSYRIKKHQQKRDGSQIIELIPIIEDLGEQSQYAIFAKQGPGAEIEHEVGYITFEESAKQGKFKLANRSYGFFENTLFLERIKGTRVDEFVQKLFDYNPRLHKQSEQAQELLRTIDHLRLRNAAIADVELSRRKNEFKKFSFVNSDESGKTAERLAKLYSLFGEAIPFNQEILSQSLSQINSALEESYTWNIDIDNTNCFISDSIFWDLANGSNEIIKYKKLGSILMESPERVISAIRRGFGSSDFDALGYENKIKLRTESDALAKISATSLASRHERRHDFFALHQLTNLLYKGKIDDLSDLDVPLLNAISQWDRTGRSVHRIDIFDQFGIDPSPVLSPDESEFSTLSRELGKIYHLVKYANLGIGAEDLIAKDPESFARLVNSFSHTVKRLFSFYQPALVEEISLSSTRKEVESHEINGALTYSLLAMQRASRDIVNDLVNLYEKRGLGDLVGHMKPGLFLPNVNELKKEYRRLVGANKSARNSSGHIRVAGRSKLSEYDLPLIRKFDNELYGLALEVLSDQVKTSRHKTYWGYDTDNSSRRELVFNQTFGHLERSFTSLIDYYASSKGEKPLISLQNIPENRNRLDLMKLIEGITSFEGTYNCERLEHNPEIEKTYQVVQNRVMAYLNKRLSSDSISSAQQG